MIELRNLRAGYRGEDVLRGVSLRFEAGKVSVLCGPNGCGKSTLLKAALGIIPRTGGEVYIDGDELGALTRREIAQRAAYMPQDRGAPSISVRRMVLHGRFPYLTWPRRYSGADYAAAERALERADALDIASRSMTELSGGQRQRAYLAMALAVAALKRHEVGRLILTRPVVEAGENLGFLPGTLEEKIDPYMRPLYDALFDMMDRERTDELMERGVIEIAPLAYMRCFRGARRGAKYHARADEDVPDTPGL